MASTSASYTYSAFLLTCLADAAAASACAASMGACMLFSSLVLGPAAAPLPGPPELVAVLPLLVLLVADPDVLGASAEAGLGALRPCALLVLVELGPRPETELLLLQLAPLFAPSLHALKVEHRPRIAAIGEDPNMFLCISGYGYKLYTSMQVMIKKFLISANLICPGIGLYVSSASPEMCAAWYSVDAP